MGKEEGKGRRKSKMRKCLKVLCAFFLVESWQKLVWMKNRRQNELWRWIYFIRKANFARGMPEKLMEEVILVFMILLELLSSMTWGEVVWMDVIWDGSLEIQTLLSVKRQERPYSWKRERKAVKRGLKANKSFSCVLHTWWNWVVKKLTDVKWEWGEESG